MPPTAISRALAVGLKAAHRAAEVRADYLRGAQRIHVDVIRTTRDVDHLDTETGATVARVTFFYVQADQLTFDGQHTPPAEGDRIEYRTPQGLEVYEAQPLANEDHYENVDPDGTEYRITTRLVELRQ